MNRLDLEGGIHQLLAIDHLRGRKACLLIESVLHEFFLQPEVLILLFSLAFTVLVDTVVHDSQLMHLLLLLVFNFNVLQNDIACFYVTLVSHFFFVQEYVSIMLGLL